MLWHPLTKFSSNLHEEGNSGNDFPKQINSSYISSAEDKFKSFESVLKSYLKVKYL